MECNKLRIRNRGSASIEASIAVILLVLVSLFFFRICELRTVDSVIYEAAAETAEYMAEYSYLAEHVTGSDLIDYPVAGLKFVSYVDDANLLEKYVTGGVYGVTLIGSKLPDDDGVIELRFTYRVSLDVPILCNFSAVKTGVIRQNAYIGGGRKLTESDQASGEKVYIADGSEVYHSTAQCSRIKRNIREVDLDDISLPPCSKCGH